MAVCNTFCFCTLTRLNLFSFHSNGEAKAYIRRYMLLIEFIKTEIHSQFVEANRGEKRRKKMQNVFIQFNQSHDFIDF